MGIRASSLAAVVASAAALAASAAVARPAPPDEPAADAPDVDVAVTVLDPADGKPAAFGDVEWWVESGGDGEAPRRVAHGSARTDLWGRIGARSFGPPAIVSVRFGDAWGRIRPGEDRRRDPASPLLVSTGPAIRVKVVDGRGPVCGARVDVLLRHESGTTLLHSAATLPPDAIAFFTVAQLAGVTGPRDFVVQLPLLTLPTVRAAIPQDRVPDEPVRLEIPPTGRVVVRLVRPDGGAFTGTTGVSLTDLARDLQADSYVVATSADGAATFPAVGLGMSLRVAQHPGSESDLLSSETTAAGPRAEGETVEVTLPAGRRKPVVTGRLFDPAGDPLGGRGVGVQLLGREPPANPRRAPVFPSQTTRTDADGRFRVAFDTDLPYTGEAEVRVVGFGTPERPDGPERELARRPWPRSEGDAVLDVGALTLTGMPALVTGTVRDEDGAPVSGMPVYVERWSEEFGWTSGDVRPSTTDAAGAFAVRGVCEPGRLRLTTYPGPQRVLDHPVSFEPGAAGVELRLVRTGTVEGRLVLPPGMDSAWVRAGLERVDAPPSDPHAAMPGLEGDVLRNGPVFWTTVRPGRYAFVVRPWGSDEPVVRVGGIDVAAGARVVDPRLASVDLRAHFRTIVVHVVGPDGSSLPGASVWYRPSADPGGVPGWLEVRPGRDGSVRIGGLAASFDVVATSPGCMPAEARGVTHEAKLALRAATPSEVIVRLADSIPAAVPPLRYAVQLVYVGGAAGTRPDFGDPRGREFLGGRSVGPEGVVAIAVAAPGRWRAALLVQMDSAGSGHGQILWPRGAAEAVVAAEAGRHEIEFDVDPDALARTVERLTR